MVQKGLQDMDVVWEVLVLEGAVMRSFGVTSYVDPCHYIPAGMLEKNFFDLKIVLITFCEKNGCVYESYFLCKCT